MTPSMRERGSAAPKDAVTALVSESVDREGSRGVSPWAARVRRKDTHRGEDDGR